MLGDKHKIKQLEEEIALLEEENKRLKKEYSIAKETEDFKTAQSYTYRDELLLYKPIPLSMITTPFYFRRGTITKKATACFMPKILKRAKTLADYALDFNPQLYFAMLCEQAITCSQGVMFILSDPYRTIQTAPINTMSEEEASEYVGKIVIAKLIIPEGYEKATYFTLKAIKKTNYASDYRMEHEDWHIIRQYLNITGKNDCIAALKKMENQFATKYPKKNNVISSYGAWIHDNEFRISTDKRLMCFCVKNDIIWYADELKNPNKAGQLSIDCSYRMYANLAEVFNDNTGIYAPLLLSGETNFEFFEDE